MSVWQQIEADARRQVQHDTWGHLGPTEGKHHGQMIICMGTYGDETVVDDSFPTLENSPWQYSSLHNIVGELLKDEDIGVYSAVGWMEWASDEDEPSALTVTDFEFELTKLVQELEHE